LPMGGGSGRRNAGRTPVAGKLSFSRSGSRSKLFCSWRTTPELPPFAGETRRVHFEPLVQSVRVRTIGANIVQRQFAQCRREPEQSMNTATVAAFVIVREQREHLGGRASAVDPTGRTYAGLSASRCTAAIRNDNTGD